MAGASRGYPYQHLVVVRAVERAGYGVRSADEPEPDETSALRVRLVGAASLSAPLAAIAMIPPLRFGGVSGALPSGLSGR